MNLISKVLNFIFQQKWGWHQQKTNEAPPLRHSYQPIVLFSRKENNRARVRLFARLYTTRALSLRAQFSWFRRKNKPPSLGGDAVFCEFFTLRIFATTIFSHFFGWTCLLICSFVTDLLRNDMYAGLNNKKLSFWYLSIAFKF